MNVRADPDSIERFSYQLEGFLSQISEAQHQLVRDFSELDAEWQDSRREEFAEALEAFNHQLDQFQARGEEFIPHLRGLVAQLRDYLGS